MLELHTCNGSFEHVSLQVVMCQWEVVIQLLEFHNPMNIETMISDNGSIKYCCCDVRLCASQTIFFLNENNSCGIYCDLFFVVTLMSLQDENFKVSSISTIEKLYYQIRQILSMFNILSLLPLMSFQLR